MKRIAAPLYISIGLLLGLAMSAVVQSNVGCQGVSTTQAIANLQAANTGAEAALAEAQAAEATQPTVPQLQAALAVASTQPSETALASQLQAQITATNNLNKQLTNLATTLANVQAGLNVAGGANQLASGGGVAPLAAAVAPLIPQPWGMIIAAALPLAYGLWQNRNANQSQQVATVAQTATAAATLALQQYAQSVESHVPDAIVNQLTSAVDSSTRAAVAASGVVPVAIPTAVPTLQSGIIAESIAPLAPPPIRQPPITGLYPATISAATGILGASATAGSAHA